MTRIYLDHNATTPINPEVLKNMLPYLEEHYGNPSSSHSWGRKAKFAIEQAREKVANLIGATSEEIYFTSGGTESNTLAIFGTLNIPEPTQIVTSTIEHYSILKPFEKLKQNGWSTSYIKCNSNGVVNLDHLKEVLSQPTLTRFLSIIHANNEVGTIQPIKNIVELCKKIDPQNNMVIHTDAVQSCGKIPLNVKELGINLLSLSGHKMYGPKGIGALYIRKGLPLRALFYGGHQERLKRAGTENVASIVGLGAACRLAQDRLTQNNSTTLIKLKKQKKQFIADILNFFPQSIINGNQEYCLDNTVNICFPGIDAQSLAIKLDLHNIAVSVGSACGAGSNEPSHVLINMGLSPKQAKNSVRFSWGLNTSDDDLKHTIKILKQVINS